MQFKQVLGISNEHKQLLTIGFVTGNPQVGFTKPVPVTHDTIPAVVVGIHYTHRLRVFLQCDSNPLRV